MADACETSVTVPKPKLNWKTALFPIAGLAAFFGYIYIFRVDIPAIIATAQTADPFPYVLAASFSLVEVFFYSVSWRTLANFLKIKLSVIRSYLFVWYGIFLDTIIPAESVSGEAVRIYLIQREQGITSCGPAAASLVAHRLLGMAMNVVVLFAGVGLLFSEGTTSGIILDLILFLAAGITVILVLLIVFSFREKWSLKVINGLANAAQFLTRGRWKGLAQIKEDACRITKSFHDSMKKFRHNPKPLVFSLLGLSVTWVFSLSTSYLVFLSLRTPVSWSVILVTSAIVLAVKSIPVGIPFEVGLPEITMTTLYTSFLGIGYAGIAATATILNRIITLWLRFFIGLGAQQYLDLQPVLTVCVDNLTTDKA
jgi:uncharacterized protein (TIRG00374 family)